MRRTYKFDYLERRLMLTLLSNHKELDDEPEEIEAV